jgi:pimeloyl-ACP methyl ester carboxylesterase
MKTILSFIVTLISFPCLAQNINGTWHGKMNVGNEITMIFHIQQSAGGGLTVSLDVPEQNAKGILTSSKLVEDSLIVEIEAIRGGFRGKLTNDSTITGKWVQGLALPLTLKKTVRAAEAAKPQTPQPPYPYVSEDVVYHNADKSIQYGATLTIPRGNGPFPAVLLLTGSGQQNRDEEIMGHKPFAVWADHLTKMGFVVLRADDRGVGQTNGNVLDATSHDFAEDAKVHLDYLKKRKETDTKRIGIIGHSEGGMIAEMIGAERKDLYFIVLLAAPGIPVIDLMTEQNEAVLSSLGLNKEHVAAYAQLYRGMMLAVTQAPDKGEANKRALAILDKWMEHTPSEVVKATTGIPSVSKEKFAEGFVNAAIPWMKFFIQYDPTPDLKKIRSKVLALNGDRDIQVLSKSNLAGIEASLKKGKAKSFQIVELRGLNHLFQECSKCTVQEYGSLEQTLSPLVLKAVGDWLEKEVRK